MMSQSKVTAYYNTRKKRADIKSSIPKQEKSKSITFASFFAELQNEHQPVPTENESQASEIQSTEADNVSKLEKTIKAYKTPKSQTKATKGKSKSVNKVDLKTDIRAAFEVQKDKIEVKIQSEQSVDHSSAADVVKALQGLDEIIKTPKKDLITIQNCESPSLPRTPKRQSQNAECGSDSKRKKLIYSSVNVTPITCSSPSDELAEKHASVRKKLVLTDDPSPTVFKSPMKLLLKLKLQDHSKTEKTNDIINDKPVINCTTISPKSTPSKTEKNLSVESLVLPVGAPSLPLPIKYKQLNDIFRCSEFIVSNCHNRKQVCTFSLLKQRVQEMRKKSFTEKNLGQMKTVYPSAYNYVIEKTIAAISNRNPGAPSHELVISLNMVESSRVTSPIKKSPSSKLNLPPCSPSNMRISSDVITKRQKIFHSSLMSIAMKHHKEFLVNLVPPMHVSPSKLFKWHPKFLLDSVPDIEVAELPKLPEKAKVCSAQDLLNKFNEIQCGGVFQKALQSVVDQTPKKCPSKEATTPISSPQSTPQSSLQNTPQPSPQSTPKTKFQEVLERIRAQNAEKMLKEMTRTPEEEKRRKMLERVPELVRTLRTYYLAEKKSTLPFETVIRKVTESCKMISQDIIEQHLRFMLELFPDWIILSTLPKKGSFLKMDKMKDTNVMLQNMPKS